MSRHRGSRKPWSVRTYLVLIVVAAVVAVTAASVYGFLWSSGQARADATEQMGLQAERAAASIAASLGTATKTVEGLAAQPGIAAVFAAPEACTRAATG